MILIVGMMVACGILCSSEEATKRLKWDEKIFFVLLGWYSVGFILGKFIDENSKND